MKRKRVLFHIGAPKTGSTFLQAFFSRNVKNFRQAGVDYPYAEAESIITSGATVGNVIGMLYRGELIRQETGSIRPASLSELWTAACADTIISVVRQSPCDTVLLSSEGISLLPQEEIVDLYERLSVDCDPEFIMFVRDPFDCFYSSWRQMVKTGRFLGGLEEFVSRYMNTGRNIGMFNACRFLFKPGVRKTLVNYDVCRKDVAGSFLKAVNIEIAVEAEQPVGPKLLHNRSLSPSESLLLTFVNNAFAGTFFPAFVRHRLLERTDYVPRLSHYYNREIDAEILKNCRQCIEDINRVVRGDPLRTFLRDAPTDEAVIEVQDISALIDAMQFVMARRSRRISLLKKIKHLVIVSLMRKVPRDFDPDAYLFMNKDVAASGTDPYLHYARNGCHEARPYRYY
jgi:hypothetical protein